MNPSEGNFNLDHHLYRRRTWWWFRLRRKGKPRIQMPLKTRDVKAARRLRDKELEKYYLVKTEDKLARLGYMDYVERGSALDRQLAEHHPTLYRRAHGSKTLKEMLTLFTDDKNSGKDAISVSTIQNYERSIKNLIAFVGDKAIADITPKEISDFRKEAELPKTKADGTLRIPATKTVRNELFNLSVLFSWAYSNEYVDRNIFEALPGSQWVLSL